VPFLFGLALERSRKLTGSRRRAPYGNKTSDRQSVRLTRACAQRASQAPLGRFALCWARTARDATVLVASRPVLLRRL